MLFQSVKNLPSSWQFSLAIGFLFLVTSCRPGTSSKFTLEVQSLNNDARQVRVTVTASDALVWPHHEMTQIKWEAILSVQLVTARYSATTPYSEPLLGKYEISGEELHFQPRFPLLSGEKYLVRFDQTAIPGIGEKSALPLTHEYQVPGIAPGAQPKVVAMYPSGERVPANHLKFYLVFSEPMRGGGIFKYFRLLDDQGGVVPEPFRETELWANDGKRLTLWFHPGRQKTDVNLNVEIGPVLTEDRHYTLEISGEWMSDKGVPLGATVRKTLNVGPPDHAQPAVVFWQLHPPTAGTRAKLEVTFPEVLDWALLQSQLWVETSEGHRIPGQAEVGTGEMSWKFVPENPWMAGAFRLAVGTVLEDLAGNSIARPFQKEVTSAKSNEKMNEVVYLPFMLKPKED